MKAIDLAGFEAFSAAILSDVLDGMGLMGQAMRPFMRPLDENSVLIGRARTGLYMPVYETRAGENPYQVEIELVDDLQPGDVPVLACNGPTIRLAPWGELLSTAAKMRGAAGCVTDGLVRDIRQIRALAFPVFHGGIGPLDTKGRGRMVERDTPVECAGVRVASGDLVFGDADGVVVIPRERAGEALERARQKLTGENHTRAELEQGTLLGEVYRKYGIL
ncbi:MAG: RraA family protein [Betaproteobacteria bacterium]|nr:RraA family protein [Betaproteobacteria bacterium]